MTSIKSGFVFDVARLGNNKKISDLLMRANLGSFIKDTWRNRARDQIIKMSFEEFLTGVAGSYQSKKH